MSFPRGSLNFQFLCRPCMPWMIIWQSITASGMSGQPSKHYMLTQIPMLVYSCRPTAYGSGPKLAQHWVNLCLLGVAVHHCQCHQLHQWQCHCQCHCQCQWVSGITQVRLRYYYTRRQINQDRMIFGDFSINSKPIFLKFCKGHFRFKSKH